jgi:hypothetical protein
VADPKDRKEVVRLALENKKYKWRTIDGVAQESKLATDEVEEALSELADEIIRSSVPSKDGQALFTTRKHYRNQQNLGARLLSALKNRS